MDSLGALFAFVHAADAGGFTEAGRKLGISASAVSKAVARLEDRLGARLFHRSTRSVTLTPEGAIFLERCRRILCEYEAAELELSQSQAAPQGRLRVSLPSMSMMPMAKLAAFKRRYPEVELELDATDRIVDVIGEGFDVVIRTGDHADSRLMTRTLGYFRRPIVGSPDYFRQMGTPETPEDLARHSRLVYRYASTGKLDQWPLSRNGEPVQIDMPISVVTNALEAQIGLAESGLGIACVPDLSVTAQLQRGSLVSILDSYVEVRTKLSLMWPASRYASPKLRVFVDFAAEEFLAA
ncbi:LysR family transcriptional regulator [Boseaceae bacterium BT-24-1]|nr:LysR family transcriptional regulator [Boseaceae bacterium BT-24-1]